MTTKTTTQVEQPSHNREKEKFSPRSHKNDGYVDMVNEEDKSFKLPDENDNDKKTPVTKFVLILTFFSAIGGFLFGYDTGVVSGALLLLGKNFQMSTISKELFVSVTIGLACLFSLVGGVLNDLIGRKPTTLLASLVFTVGALLLGFASNLITLIIGRAILGIGIGLASTTVPVYIAECAPAHLRGQLVTLNNLFITGGQFVASLVDGAFSYDRQNGWRYMLGLASIPSLIQLIGFLFLPESPRWLISKGYYQRARDVLADIRGTSEINQELNSIQESTKANAKGESFSKICRILKTPHVRRALIVGCGLQFFQQLCGINSVMYYSASIIKMAGVQSDTAAIWLASMTAGINFIFSIVGVCLVDRIGRRKLTLGSLTGIIVGLSVLAISFKMMASDSPPVTLIEPGTQNFTCSKYSSCYTCTENVNCGFCYDTHSAKYNNASCVSVNQTSEAYSTTGRCSSPTNTNITHSEFLYNFCPTSYSWIAILGLALYLMFFAPGMGPMPWTVNSEIYPLWARGTGNSVATAVNWICNLFVSMTFLTLTQVLSKDGTFWLFVVITVIGLIFTIVCLPETKGLQLEEVETLFKKNTLCIYCQKKSYKDLNNESI